MEKFLKKEYWLMKFKEVASFCKIRREECKVKLSEFKNYLNARKEEYRATIKEGKGNIEEAEVKEVKEEVKIEITNESYWMITCNPNKWFGEKNPENANVNNILKYLETYSWDIGKVNLDIQNGDKGIIKISGDGRIKKDRTINKELFDKLEPGIYAEIEFVEKDGKVVFVDDKGVNRANIRVLNNLFNTDKIIDKEKSIKILGKLFNSYKSKEITKDMFVNIIIEDH